MADFELAHEVTDSTDAANNTITSNFAFIFVVFKVRVNKSVDIRIGSLNRRDESENRKSEVAFTGILQ